MQWCKNITLEQTTLPGLLRSTQLGIYNFNVEMQNLKLQIIDLLLI